MHPPKPTTFLGQSPSIRFPSQAQTTNRPPFSETEVEVNLPGETDLFTSDEKQCFSQEKIYWPQDGHCYTLLEQGPCKKGQWLVTSKVANSAR